PGFVSTFLRANTWPSAQRSHPSTSASTLGTDHVNRADGWKGFRALARSLPRLWLRKWGIGKPSRLGALAAWIGLVPKQHSTGGKERLGSITKQGNRYLRWLLVVGAMAVIRYARQHGTKWLWLARLMERRPPKVAAVAFANKIARMAWAMMVRDERFTEAKLLPAS